ncbi:MAG: DUF192 domain-containing protein [Candidatus Sulfotelmatobacter sp.]
MRATKSTARRLPYFLAGLHFCFCLVSATSYFTPNWPYLALGWEVLAFVDFPVSIIAIWLDWRNHSELALLCYFAIGTAWWFFLGREISSRLDKRSVLSSYQAFNQTRQLVLATSLAVAQTHWSRLVGLLGASEDDFRNGCGLWIRPCRGVHTLAMRFPIDVVYLDRGGTVVHLERALRPWRIAPVRLQAASVLELPQNTVTSTRTALGDRIEIKIKEEV